MTERKPRIEDVVSALTARLASAHEIRAHVARLQALASAQEDEARDFARAALGDVHGESLFQTIRTVYDHGTETGSRVGEVPGLVGRLAAPWETPPSAPADTRAPAEEAPVRAEPVPAIPEPVRPVAAAHPAVVAAESPVPAPVPAAPAQVVPVPTPVESSPHPAYPGGAAAEKIIRKAQELAATGDPTHYDTHGTKWVGVHQWRRDLFRAAFAEAAAAAGLALPAAEPTLPAPDIAPPPIAESAPPAPAIVQASAPVGIVPPPPEPPPYEEPALRHEQVPAEAVGLRDPPPAERGVAPVADLLDGLDAAADEFDGVAPAYEDEPVDAGSGDDEEDDMTFGEDEGSHAGYQPPSAPPRQAEILTSALVPAPEAPAPSLPDFLMASGDDQPEEEEHVGRWPDIVAEPPRRPMLPPRPMLPLKVAPGLRRP